MEERKKGPLHIGETMERRQGGKGYGMGGGSLFTMETTKI